jgi:Flp pilus assembly pilin Flp
MLKFLSEDSGAASAEYALIIVMIALGLGVAVWGMADAVANRVSWAGAQLAEAAGVEIVSTESEASPARPAAVAASAKGAARASAAGHAAKSQGGAHASDQAKDHAKGAAAQ